MPCAEFVFNEVIIEESKDENAVLIAVSESLANCLDQRCAPCVLSQISDRFSLYCSNVKDHDDRVSVCLVQCNKSSTQFPW